MYRVSQMHTKTYDVQCLCNERNYHFMRILTQLLTFAQAYIHATHTIHVCIRAHLHVHTQFSHNTRTRNHVENWNDFPSTMQSFSPIGQKTRIIFFALT